MTIIYILFDKIAELSFMGCFVVACILLTKRILKNNMGVKFQYAIWFILILRLLLPITPSSNLSIYNYVPSYESTMMNIPIVFQNIDKFNNNGEELSSISLEKSESKVVNYLTTVKEVMPFIWICGVFIIASAIFISNEVFFKRIKKYPRIEDKNVLNLFNDCKILMKISKNICLVKTNDIKTPCVLNFIKPIILIPENSLEECNLTHLKYVFLHELAHVKRKDIFINYVVSFLCIIYWFNPLIWYGFHKMREDREICCDSLALSYLRDEEVKSYGFTIIKLAEISSRAPCLPAMVGIINNKSKIKRRIEMIKVFKKNSYRLSALALGVLLIAGGALLTGATEANTTNSNSTPIVDKIDYPFVNDDEVIGKWETVDFVKAIDDFDVNLKSWKDDLYLKSMTVLPDGKMTQPVCEGITSDEITPVSWLTWTNGYIIHHNDKTAGQYTIKEIDGSKYMFWEWKSGDYSVRGMKPYYYVLKQVK